VTQWGHEKEFLNDGLPQEYKHGQLVVLSVCEEVAGQTTMISPEILESVFTPTPGSKVSFVLMRDSKKITITTPDIKALKLIGKTTVNGVVEEMTVQFYPMSLADDIARTILGSVRYTQSEESQLKESDA
jgi:hypothetical protein